MRNPSADAENGQATRRSHRLTKNVVVIRKGLPLSEKRAGGIKCDQAEREEEERERHDRGGLPPFP